MREYFPLVLHSLPSPPATHPTPHCYPFLSSTPCSLSSLPSILLSLLPSPIHFYSILNWEQSKKNVRVRKILNMVGYGAKTNVAPPVLLVRTVYQGRQTIK